MNKRVVVLIAICLGLAGGTWLGFTWWKKTAFPEMQKSEFQEAVYRLQIATGARIKPTNRQPSKDPLEAELLNCKLNEAILKDLGLLTTLHTINLGSTQLRDDDLKHLEKLTNLEVLYLGGTAITDAAADRLKPFGKLKTLHLGQTAVTDAALEKLKELPELSELYINDTAITDAGLEKLKHLPKLAFVFIGSNTKATPEGIDRVCKALPNVSIY